MERLGLWTLRCSRAEHRDRRLEETRYPCLIKIGWENNGTQQKRRRGVSVRISTVYSRWARRYAFNFRGGELECSGIKRKETQKTFEKIIKYVYFIFEDL